MKADINLCARSFSVATLPFLSDEATVNRHSYVWGSDNLHDVIEHERDSPKISMLWCTLMKNGPLFSEELRLTGSNFLLMMENTALRHVPVGAVL
jgi:hypothetical protein